MTDKENLLIENFFKEAARQQVEDNGFARRVMESLPAAETKSRTHRLSLLWTWFCIAVAAVLFFAIGGWAALKASAMMLLSTGLTALKVFVTTAPTAEVRLDPVQVVLLVVFVGVFLPYQTYRRLSAAL